MSKEIKCYIEKNYKVDHSEVPQIMQNSYVMLGHLFEGYYICSWCLMRLVVVADVYGNSQRGTLRGNVINIDAKVSLEEMINKSPLKKVFSDYDISDIKYNIDNHLYELNPQQPIRPTIESEMARISHKRIIRK